MKEFLTRKEAKDDFAKTNPSKRHTRLVSVQNELVWLMATPMAEDNVYDLLENLFEYLEGLGFDVNDDTKHELNQAVIEQIEEKFECTTDFLETEF